MAEHESAQSHQDARRSSIRRCRVESDVLGVEKPAGFCEAGQFTDSWAASNDCRAVASLL